MELQGNLMKGGKMEKQFKMDCSFGVCKALPTPDGVIRIAGLANVYSKDGIKQPDRVDELVNPFGIKLDNYLKNSIMLFNHDYDKPIGVITQIVPTIEGLQVVGEVYKDLNPNVYTAVEKGVLKAFSIGFRASDYMYDEQSDAFIIGSSELYEISVVAVPCSPLSLFQVDSTAKSLAVKGLDWKKGTSNNDGLAEVKQLEELQSRIEVLEALAQKEQQPEHLETPKDEPKEVPQVDEQKPDSTPEPEPQVITLEQAKQTVLDALADRANIDDLLLFSDTFSASLNTAVNTALNQ